MTRCMDMTILPRLVEDTGIHAQNLDNCSAIAPMSPAAPVTGGVVRML